MTNNTVAANILSALGGNRFIAMTGARNMSYSDNSLTVQFPRMTGAKANCLRVTLTAMDDYQIEALAIRGLDCKPVAFRDGVQVEGLKAAVARAIQREIML